MQAQIYQNRKSIDVSDYKLHIAAPSEVLVTVGFKQKQKYSPTQGFIVWVE
jgi:hypothetical protein